MLTPLRPVTVAAPPPDVRSLWKPLFTVDRADHPCFVFDQTMRCMVASKANLGRGPVIPRGWGRIQYLKDGDKLMTAWEQWWQANIPPGATLTEAAALLNAAWGAK